MADGAADNCSGFGVSCVAGDGGCIPSGHDDAAGTSFSWAPDSADFNCGVGDDGTTTVHDECGSCCSCARRFSTCCRKLSQRSCCRRICWSCSFRLRSGNGGASSRGSRSTSGLKDGNGIDIGRGRSSFGGWGVACAASIALASRDLANGVLCCGIARRLGTGDRWGVPCAGEQRGAGESNGERRSGDGVADGTRGFVERDGDAPSNKPCCFIVFNVLASMGPALLMSCKAPRKRFLTATSSSAPRQRAWAVTLASMTSPVPPMKPPRAALRLFSAAWSVPVREAAFGGGDPPSSPIGAETLPCGALPWTWPPGMLARREPSAACPKSCCGFHCDCLCHGNDGLDTIAPATAAATRSP
mmetsp:Transcript_35545/g.102393  ORF Transcript_35545/g.102393 Transcript_35545/m.102393 type:complete len:358 (+) Transcript_35545:2016-3089(+)